MDLKKEIAALKKELKSSKKRTAAAVESSACANLGHYPRGKNKHVTTQVRRAAASGRRGTRQTHNTRTKR